MQKKKAFYGPVLYCVAGDGRDIYARIVNRMKKELNRNMDVLELACGTGILSVQLAGNVKMLEATDFSEEMIKQAKQKCNSSRLHFSLQDATGLGVDEKTAAADACQMEHAVSRESYEALKSLAAEKNGGNL